jgi:hypothetical protein
MLRRLKPENGWLAMLEGYTSLDIPTPILGVLFSNSVTGLFNKKVR